MKCETPPTGAASSREPTPTKTPIAAERSPDIAPWRPAAVRERRRRDAPASTRLARAPVTAATAAPTVAIAVAAAAAALAVGAIGALAGVRERYL